MSTLCHVSQQVVPEVGIKLTNSYSFCTATYGTNDLVEQSQT